MKPTSSPIVIGTEVYSGNWGVHYSSSDIENILTVALQNGVAEIDTAASYGENHSVEKLIGEATVGVREKMVLASKFLNNHIGKKKGDFIATVSELEQELFLTLNALKTSYLDIYYFHSGCDDAYFQDHIWAWLNEMVQQGVIRKLGLSLNHGLVKANQNRQLLAAKAYGISVIQTVLNLFSQEALSFVIPYCQREGLTVYGRMPLAKGLLSGKYARETVFQLDDPRGRDPEITSSILDFVDRSDHDMGVGHAIRWSLGHAEKIVIGTKTISQLKDVIECACTPAISV